MLNVILAVMIMSFNKPLPSRIDLALNREISILVLLKNKNEDPDLFSIHGSATKRSISQDENVRRLFDLTLKHEKFETKVFRLWGRQESELRQIILYSYLRDECLQFNPTTREQNRLLNT